MNSRVAFINNKAEAKIAAQIVNHELYMLDEEEIAEPSDFEGQYISNVSALFFPTDTSTRIFIEREVAEALTARRARFAKKSR